MLRGACATIFLLACPPSVLGAPLELGFEAFIGVPVNVHAPMEIRQDGMPTLDFDASFRSEPLEPPFYWAMRLSIERGRDGFSLEVMHDKLILESAPSEIQEFVISHGFNFVTLQRALPLPPVRVRLGLGAILAHPENEVRQRKLDQTDGIFGRGYYLAGPAATVAVERRFPFWEWTGLALEGRVSVASARLPVADGEARFTHLAVHLLLGVTVFPD